MWPAGRSLETPALSHALGELLIAKYFCKTAQRVANRNGLSRDTAFDKVGKPLCPA